MSGDGSRVTSAQSAREWPERGVAEAEGWLSTDEAEREGFRPSTPWEYGCQATLRFLERQQRRAQSQLGLEAVIVRNTAGMIALWTREP